MLINPKRQIRKFSRMGLVLGLSALVGCAHAPPPRTLGPLEPVVRAYSRNGIVSIPTSVGNAIGVPIGIITGALVIPAASIVDGILTGGGEIPLKLWANIAIGHAYLFGAAFGTPFLPFSYLAPAHPWPFKKVSDCEGCDAIDEDGNTSHGTIE